MFSLRPIRPVRPLRTLRPCLTRRPLQRPLQRLLQTGTANHPTTSTSTSTRPPPPASDSPLSGYVESVELNISPSITAPIPSHTRNLISSILDLFAGRPSLPKLSQWATDCTLETPIHKSSGLPQVSAQWYAMKKLMDEIKVMKHVVTKCEDGGKKIAMDMKVKYVLGGVGKSLGEVEVPRRVEIEVNDTGKITRVYDCWGGADLQGIKGWMDMLRKKAAGVAEKMAKVPLPGSK